MDHTDITIEITQGAIKNNYLGLTRHLDFFPRDAIGGPNLDTAGRALEVDFGRGLTVTTDIADDKGIFRERSAVRRFLTREGATVGSRVLIRRLGEYRYAVSMAA